MRRNDSDLGRVQCLKTKGVLIGAGGCVANHKRFRDHRGNTPHGMHLLMGCTMGPGWRKVINSHIGGTAGCTHLREMLFNMATAAYQTLPSGRWHRRELTGQPHPEVTQAPYHLGQCHSWACDSPTVQRAYPMFFRPTPPHDTTA